MMDARAVAARGVPDVVGASSGETDLALRGRVESGVATVLPVGARAGRLHHWQQAARLRGPCSR